MTEDEAIQLNNICNEFWVEFSKLVARSLDQNTSPDLEDPLLEKLGEHSSVYGSDYAKYRTRGNTLQHFVEMSQAFADAFCNDHSRRLRHEPHDPENVTHARQRRRGIEGANGVACDDCRIRASTVWDEYQLILFKMKKAKI